MTHINAYVAEVGKAEDELRHAKTAYKKAVRALEQKRQELGASNIEEAKDSHEETKVDQKIPATEGRPSQQVEKSAKSSKK